MPEHLHSPQCPINSWVNKGLGISSCVSVTGHIKDTVALIEKSRALCPSGRLPPSYIHQVIIITGLNKLNTTVTSRPEDGLRCRQGVKPPLQTQKLFPCSINRGLNITKHCCNYHCALQAVLLHQSHLFICLNFVRAW